MMVEQTNLTNDQCVAQKDYLLERFEDGHLKQGGINEADDFFLLLLEQFPNYGDNGGRHVPQTHLGHGGM